MGHCRRQMLALTAMMLLPVLLSGCGLPWFIPQPTPDLKLPDAQQVFRPLDNGATAGDITRSTAGDVDTLDPAQIQFGSDYDKAQLIFPQLVTLDEREQPIDWVAESHDVSADGLTYTFHLRNGMQWSDGTPIDASTFAYSINRALDPCLASGVAYYLYDLHGAEAFNKGVCPVGAIKSATTLLGSSIQTPDPLTLRLQLAHPAGYFLAALTYPTSWAVPQALVEKYTRLPTDPHDWSPTVSTWTAHLTDQGPFGGNLYRLTKWDHAGHIEFERNERFWGQKPLLRRIEYTLYKSPDVAWTDFTTGKGDLSQPPIGYPGSSRHLKDTVIQQAPQLALSYLRPNWHIAPFNDMRVRQALSLVLDRSRIAEAAMSETNVPNAAFNITRLPTTHLVPEGMPGYNPALTDAAGRTGTDALTPQLTTARALASAYAAEQCGGRLEHCPPINLIYSSRERTSIALVAQWRAAFPNWPISAFRCDRECQLLYEAQESYQLTYGGWLADYPDPQDFLSLLWSTRGASNRSFVSIPAVDALCAQADALGNQGGRIQLYQQAEQLLVTQGAAIPLYQSIDVHAVRSRVVNWRLAPTGMTPLSVWQETYMRR